MEDKALESEAALAIAAKVKVEQIRYEKELRGLELKAYAGVLEAVRASGKPNPEKEGLLKSLREFFNISDDRHKAEIRMLAFDDNLSLISKKLTGHTFTEEWAVQAQRVYVPLGAETFSLFKNLPSSSPKPIVVRDPIPSGRKDDEISDSDSDYSESELELLNNYIESTTLSNGWQSTKTKTFSIAVDPGTGNEAEIAEIKMQANKPKVPVKRQHSAQPLSPDIVDVTRTPRKEEVSEEKHGQTEIGGKSRRIKRKRLEEVNQSPSSETSARKLTAKKLSEKSKNLIKVRSSRAKPKVKAAPSRSESKKAKESSEETSSADEGENGPVLPDESSRVLSPVFSEVIRTSVVVRGRGRGYKRNSNDRRRNNMLHSASGAKSGKSRTPNQKSAKFKNSAPTTGSRRKSKLNEKIDYDEVLMDLDGNELDKQRNSEPHINDDPSRRLLYENQTYNDRLGITKDYTSEDCAVYTDSLTIYNHEDLEQVTDGVFKRPLPPSKGPKPWEIKDARLNHFHNKELVADENAEGSSNCATNDVHYQRSASASSPTQINNAYDPVTPTTPPRQTDSQPPTKKQRIKSPLIVNPNVNSSANVPKVPLAAPVFSTSLSSTNKKRNLNNNKPISVVDSLNLHLPTSATASSLAASSNNRRPGIVAGGCSMFSNSTALIAGARGTAPGILQQQRKAHPHILSNSKVHQRSFLPAINSNVPCNNMVPIVGSSATLASPTSPGASVGHAVQITGSPIPISSISSPSPTPLPFQSFSGSPPSSINLGSGVPVGHVNRSASGTNIIFVQKTNNTPTVGGGAEVPSNVIPIKTQPRAVILRRAQIPRQGNVMILDMQKNQLVTPVPGQSPPFLQTSRVVNAPGELSLVNIQQPTSPRKNSPSLMSPAASNQALNSSVQISQQGSEMQVGEETFIQTSNVESFASASEVSEAITSVPVEATGEIATNAIHDNETENVTSHSDNENDESVQGPPQDVQYAQIEAELMQMEGSFGEVVYEEEVTTELVPLEDSDNTQYIFTTDGYVNDEEVFMIPQEPTQHNVSSVSGSSTDTASENEITLSNFTSPDSEIPVTKVSLSPTGEMKMASEAISRALTLSKATAKTLTFTTPISLGTAATLVGNLAIGSKSGADAMNSVVQPIFQTTTELNPTAIVVEAGNPSSTNSVHNIGNSQTGIEFVLHNNELIQQPIVQENANTS